MKKIIGIIGVSVGLALVIGIGWLCSTYLGSGNWPRRFHSELDAFFGEGTWECISEEEKESRMYKVTVRNAGTDSSSQMPGSYKNWDIAWTTPAGEKEIWRITNHTLKINQDENWIFSKKRLSNKQAFVLELRQIAESIAAEEVHQDIIEKVLTEEEADCITVSVGYYGGNPKPEFYDKLWEEEWFQADSITMDNFLATELYDFSLWIHIYEYRFEQLSEEEQQHVLDSFAVIQQLLLEKYGENATFELYWGDDYEVEYINGVKQD